MTNEQENFWAGSFGKGYVERNSDYHSSIATRCALFSDIISRTRNVQSIMEFGANIGLNLHALGIVKPEAELNAIEINSETFKVLNKIPNLNAINSSLLVLDDKNIPTVDLTFTSGVLIHIHPDDLNKAYENLYKYSNKYIVLIEYYNPTPVMIPYHGENDRLFKRDFAGDLLNKYSDLELVDYGFKYHRDNNYAEDDLNWFILKKP